MGLKPQLSIAIASFNSMRTLPRIIDSIERQSLERGQYEIFLVDGGSTDSTLSFAESKGIPVLENPQTDPVSAKHKALLEAKADLLMFLDHDEELLNQDTFAWIVDIFRANELCVAGVLGGYVTPKASPKINKYFNEFGDPFSCYFYGQSKEFKRFEKIIGNFWQLSLSGEFADVYKPKVESASNAIIELVALGSIVRRSWFLLNCPDLSFNKWLIPHLYYLALNKPNVSFAFLKKASVAHHSLDSLNSFVHKIRWRVFNNTFGRDDIAQSGFSGRAHFSRWSALKKYFYIPYVFLVLPVLTHSVYLGITRKSLSHLWHFPLSFFTAGTIVKYQAMKFFGAMAIQKNYDGSIKKDRQRLKQS